MFITRRRRSFVSGPVSPPVPPIAAPTLTSGNTFLYDWDFGDSSKVSATGGLINNVISKGTDTKTIVGTTTTRPTVDTRLGKQAARFTLANATFMQAAGVNLPPGGSFVAINEFINLTIMQGIASKVGATASVSQNRTELYTATTTGLAMRKGGTGAGSAVDASYASNPSGIHCLVGTADPTTGAIALYVDGTSTPVTAAGPITGTNDTMVQVGARWVNGAMQSPADSYQWRVLFSQATLNALDAEEIAIWAAANYGTPNIA